MCVAARHVGFLLSMRMVAQGQRALLQNAGPYNENSLVGVPDEVNTGEQFGSGEKVNVCKFPLGSVNAWNVSLSLRASCLRCALLAHARHACPFA